jgi:hypothetical protein
MNIKSVVFFLFNFVKCREIPDHPEENLANFGNNPDMKLKK